jgi:hypothetical protein
MIIEPISLNLFFHFRHRYSFLSCPVRRLGYGRPGGAFGSYHPGKSPRETGHAPAREGQPGRSPRFSINHSPPAKQVTEIAVVSSAPELLT